MKKKNQSGAITVMVTFILLIIFSTVLLFLPEEKPKKKNPTPIAETAEFTSQFTVVVEPTAAVAAVPSVPTIIRSIYCTRVCISCSSIVGIASANIVVSIADFPFLFIGPPSYKKI